MPDMPETPCTKRTSIHIKNLRINHLCNRKAGDFATAFRPEKFPGLSRYGPLGGAGLTGSLFAG